MLPYTYRSITSLQIDLTGSPCPHFEYSESLQIYDSMNVYHFPAPVSKYCILLALHRQIRTLTTKNGRGIDTDILPPCTLGTCSA